MLGKTTRTILTVLCIFATITPSCANADMEDSESDITSNNGNTALLSSNANVKSVKSNADQLQHSEYVPDRNHPDIDFDLLRVSCSENPSNYYCTNAFLTAVQNSPNRIKVNGGEFVITPNKTSNQLDYDLSFIKDNVVIPSHWHINNIEAGASKFGKMGNELCVYGSFGLGLSSEGSLYNCVVFDSEYYEDVEDSTPISHSSTYYENLSLEQFEKIVAGELDSNYETFSEVH